MLSPLYPNWMLSPLYPNWMFIFIFFCMQLFKQDSGNRSYAYFEQSEWMKIIPFIAIILLKKTERISFSRKVESVFLLANTVLDIAKRKTKFRSVLGSKRVYAGT